MKQYKLQEGDFTRLNQLFKLIKNIDFVKSLFSHIALDREREIINRIALKIQNFDEPTNANVVTSVLLVLKEFKPLLLSTCELGKILIDKNKDKFKHIDQVIVSEFESDQFSISVVEKKFELIKLETDGEIQKEELNKILKSFINLISLETLLGDEILRSRLLEHITEWNNDIEGEEK